MNAKFRMSKFGRNAKAGGVMKELLITLSGHWEIVGDTLVRTFDMQTLKIDSDESGITCTKDERENQLPEVRRLIMETLKERGFLGWVSHNNRMAHATNLDRTGTRLELTETDKIPVHYQRRIEKR